MDVNWLQSLMELQGVQHAALIDGESGLVLEAQGDHAALESVAQTHAEWVRLARQLQSAGSSDVCAGAATPDSVEEILVQMPSCLHLVRPLQRLEGVVLSVLLQRPQGNAALAQRLMREVEDRL